MIVNRLNNEPQNQFFFQKLQTAFQYLTETDFSALPDGKYEINGNQMFAVVQRYNTAPEESIHFESHKDYIDVQYIVSGTEKILQTDITKVGEICIPYNKSEDIVFYNDPPEKSSELFLFPGDYAVFLPEDCHKTRCNANIAHSEPILKVIVKLHL